jgi:predicted nuclease of predicted toxin-antitoxin system
VKLAEPYTFFVDRSLVGAFVAGALREAGHAVIAHDDEFEADARDVEWLHAVGKRGWVVLTKDARIRTNAIERGSLLSSKVAAFMLGRGDMKGPQMAATFIAALPRMAKVLRRWDLPLVATITAVGRVSVLYANGVRLQPARLVK